MNQRKEAEMDKVHQGTSSLRPCHFPLGKPQVYWNFANLHKCFVCVCVCVCSVAQSGLTFWDPVDCSLPGFSVHGIFPGKNTRVVCHSLLQGISLIKGSNLGLLLGRWILYHWATWEALYMNMKVKVLVAQSCPTLCNPMDCSPPGSSVCGIL